MEHDAAQVRSSRGRVVMLVDNGVEGDSRVQKQARSAAEAGWDVTLLGKGRAGTPVCWTIGRATVRLVPMPTGANPPAEDSARAGSSARAGAKARVKSTLHGMGWAGAAAIGAVRGVRRVWDHAYTMFWTTVESDRAWRRLEPGLLAYEQAYGPVIDELVPDLIHANDFRMLGVGARATLRARQAGRDVKLVWDAHEFLPGVKPWRDSPRWLPAHCGYEREFAPYADAVVTVSDALAGMLQREHGLAARPTVVLNAPDVDPEASPPAHEPAVDLRAACGIGAEVPLLVYAGLAAQQRGLMLMVDTLPRQPGVHAAFVVGQPDGAYCQELLARARRRGVADRLHLLPYVSPWRVVSYLAAADVGVIPIQHWPNYEISLTTKFLEYSHARLPIVVSDVRTMAATVARTGQGEIFRAGDVEDYCRAVAAVLADPQRYRSAYDAPGLLAGWTWRAQADALDGVYRSLLASPPTTTPATTSSAPPATTSAPTSDAPPASPSTTTSGSARSA
jgi:glycogen synthase